MTTYTVQREIPYRDLLWVIIASTLAVIFTLLDVQLIALRLVVTLPLAIFLPGYALTSAIFAPQSIDSTQRFGLSIALSIAVTVVGGFILNFTTWGLRAESWATWYSGLILTCCAAALYRRSRASHIAMVRLRLQFSPLYLIPIVLTLIIVTAAFLLTRNSALQNTGNGFTQLWVLPIDKAKPATITFGIQSMEPQRMQYMLSADVGGTLVNHYEWPLIDLAPGEEWQNDIDLPLDSTGKITVDLALYRLDNPSVVYRHLSIKP